MSDIERRLFPRMQVTCPVLYHLDKTKGWKVAKMVNLSATGIQFVCTDEPSLNTYLSIHVKPGSKKNIPELIAKGLVTRIEKVTDEEYLLACKLTDVSST